MTVVRRERRPSFFDVRNGTEAEGKGGGGSSFSRFIPSLILPIIVWFYMKAKKTERRGKGQR